LGNEIAIRAIALVGHPYVYGGADLQGFDCSGLVYFIHEQLGLDVPRTAADQQRAAQTVQRGDLAPGDLLFFHTSGRGVSHVGIYVGENRFIHAPQSGRLIELRSLDDRYYSQHWVASGRFWPAS
jgi:cell wall-associated NlpC family hydrolase